MHPVISSCLHINSYLLHAFIATCICLAKSLKVKSIRKNVQFFLRDPHCIATRNRLPLKAILFFKLCSLMRSSHCTTMAEQGGRRDLDKLVKDGLSALVFGVGYKVGTIDHFIKTKQPCTAQELAEKTGMKQR